MTLLWVFLPPTLAAGVWLGWQLRDSRAERDEYRREDERDRAWDAEHGIGGVR